MSLTETPNDIVVAGAMKLLSGTATPEALRKALAEASMADLAELARRIRTPEHQGALKQLVANEALRKVLQVEAERALQAARKASVAEREDLQSQVKQKLLSEADAKLEAFRKRTDDRLKIAEQNYQEHMKEIAALTKLGTEARQKTAAENLANDWNRITTSWNRLTTERNGAALMEFGGSLVHLAKNVIIDLFNRARNNSQATLDWVTNAGQFIIHTIAASPALLSSVPGIGPFANSISEWGRDRLDRHALIGFLKEMLQPEYQLNEESLTPEAAGQFARSLRTQTPPLNLNRDIVRKRVEQFKKFYASGGHDRMVTWEEIIKLESAQEAKTKAETEKKAEEQKKAAEARLKMGIQAFGGPDRIQTVEFTPDIPGDQVSATFVSGKWRIQVPGFMVTAVGDPSGAVLPGSLAERMKQLMDVNLTNDIQGIKVKEAPATPLIFNRSATNGPAVVSVEMGQIPVADADIRRIAVHLKGENCPPEIVGANYNPDVVGPPQGQNGRPVLQLFSEGLGRRIGWNSATNNQLSTLAVYGFPDMRNAPPGAKWYLPANGPWISF